MAGIAGIAHIEKTEQVERMLDRMAHRGPAGRAVTEVSDTTIGVVWTESEDQVQTVLVREHAVGDDAGAGHLAEARVYDNNLVLRRDPLGVAPLYYGWTEDGKMAFASEVKALQEVSQEVRELPPGHHYDGRVLVEYERLAYAEPLKEAPEKIAAELRRRLAEAVEKRVGDGRVGAWLSGGLDSSAIVALAQPHMGTLHTFVSGLPGAPDLEHARAVADFVGTEHHEVVVQPEELIAALPETIYHLESFDAWLVRSSITNFLVAKVASDYVPAVLSGEGGDELFAGYSYLKTLDRQDLPGELLDITGRLHNTALQRVDRCASAHGMIAHVPFLDPEVADYALRIPMEYKLRDGVEKWIVRRSVEDVLPTDVVNRDKTKFWEGTGVADILTGYAEERISDAEFERERTLPNGWVLRSKEEMCYYRIFRQYFGMDNLDWMGRTKGVPVS